MDDASRCDLEDVMPPLERRQKSQRNKLVDVRVERVDIVPAGAQGRVFALRKGHEEKNMPVNFPALLETRLEKAADVEAVIKSLPEEAKALLEGTLKLLQAGADSIPADVLTKALDVVGVRVPAAPVAEDPVAKMMDGEMTCPKCGTKIKAKMAKEHEEPVAKAMQDPEVARLIKERDEQLERLTKEHQAEVRLRKSRDFEDAIRKEFGTEMQPAAIPALFAASQGEPVAKADYDNLHRMLKGMIEMVRDGAVMRQNQGRTSTNDGVSDRIAARVTELKKADPKLTDREAQIKAFEEDPVAYEQFRATWPTKG